MCPCDQETVDVNAELSSDVKSTVFTYTATIIVGNKFYKGDFMPAAELEKSLESWNGTLHDINHMGTTRITPLGISSDIRYFVGWQDSAEYDEATKSIKVKVNIDTETMYGKVLKSYIDLCQKANKMPNVSISFGGQIKGVPAKDLPIDYSNYNLKPDDIISYIYDIKPRALSTVLKGACSDEQGCGIGVNVVRQNSENNEKKFSDEKQKLIEELKKLDEEK